MIFWLSLRLGSNGFLRGAIVHQLDRLEQATATDISDVAVIAEALGQPTLEMFAKLFHPVEQFLLDDHALHFERGRTGERMRQISVAVLERARTLPDRVDDARGREHRADRLIAAAEPLGDRLDVGRDALLLPRMQRASAAHAAHHLVEDQERTMLIADLTHGTEITFRRRNGAPGRADHRLGNEGRDRVGTKPLELGFQIRREPRDKIRLGFIVALFMIGKRRGDMAERRRQQRRIRLAPPGVAAGRQCAERVAVIALPPRDEALALRLSGLEKILPRDLDRGFDRFRAAADEIDVSEPARLVADQMIGQRLRRFRREERGVRIGEFRSLLRHRLENARMLVAEAGHRGAAGGIQYLAAVLAKQPDALPANRLRRRLAEASVQHAAFDHDDQPLLGNVLRQGGKAGFGILKPLFCTRTTQGKRDRGQ